MTLTLAGALGCGGGVFLYAQGESNPRLEAWLKSEQQRKDRFLTRVGPLAERAGIILPDSVEAHGERENLAILRAAEGYPQELSAEFMLTAPVIAIPKEGKYLPGETRIRYENQNRSEVIQLNDVIRLATGASSGVKPGDLFRIYEMGPVVRNHKQGRGLGRLLETKGIIEITNVQDKASQGRLVRSFGTISTAARACPLIHPKILPLRKPEVSGDSKLGYIVQVSQYQNLAQPYTFMIVDGGEGTGFRAGDRIEIMNKVKSQTLGTSRIARGIIIEMGENWASVFVNEVYPGKLQAGDWVRAPMESLAGSAMP